MSLWCGALCFLISGSGFIYGIVRLFKKGVPLYFQLMVCAAGCYALSDLHTLVGLLCGDESYGLTVVSVAILGCFCFLVSANYGQLDRVVDDRGKKNTKAALIAGIFPAGIAAFMIGYAVYISGSVTPLHIAIVLLIYLPSLPASYFSLKHLLIPVDELGLLRATRGCNILTLTICLLEIAYLPVYLFLSDTAKIVLCIITSAAAAALVFACERGFRIWKTSI